METTDGVKKTRGPRKNGNGAEKAEKPVKVAKPKKEAVKKDRFGFRVGSKKSQAAAMYAAKKGATLAEVKTALNSSQFNLIVELEKRNIQVDRIKVPGIGKRQITRFHIVAPK